MEGSNSFLCIIIHLDKIRFGFSGTNKEPEHGQGNILQTNNKNKEDCKFGYAKDLPLLHNEMFLK